MTTSTVLVELPAGDPVLADFLEENGQLPAAMAVRCAEPVVYLWLLSQTENGGYDTYDSCVVAAVDEQSAKRIRPSGSGEFDERRQIWAYKGKDGWRYNPGDDGYDERNDEVGAGDWATHPDQVTAKRIGVTSTEPPGTVICASFNAG